MLTLAPWFLCASVWFGNPPEQDAPSGYLWQPAFSVDKLRRAPAVPYEPQPGDLVLLNTSDRLWRISHYVALSGPPGHNALVVRKPDGQLGLLEAGIDMSLDVQILPPPQRMAEYAGDVYVRQRKTPLTKEESDRLTDFALAVERKRIAVVRLGMQLTPIRTRGPLRTFHLGKPNGVRQAYICSELAVEALVAASLLDANTARPAATFPRDLFFDHSANLYLNRHLSPQISAGWHAPRLWTIKAPG